MEKPFSEWSATWQKYGFNNCLPIAIEALKYLSENDRPIGGEDHYNAIHLLDIAASIDKTINARETERLRNSALAKLTDDEKKALGF